MWRSVLFFTPYAFSKICISSLEMYSELQIRISIDCTSTWMTHMYFKLIKFKTDSPLPPPLVPHLLFLQ